MRIMVQNPLEGILDVRSGGGTDEGDKRIDDLGVVFPILRNNPVHRNNSEGKDS